MHQDALESARTTGPLLRDVPGPLLFALRCFRLIEMYLGAQAKESYSHWAVMGGLFLDGLGLVWDAG